MTTHIDDDFLDRAVSQLGQDQSTADIVGTSPEQAEEIQPLLQAVDALQIARSTNQPTTESLRDDRNDFLAGITELQLLPVSPSPIGRLKGWVSQKAALLSLASSNQPMETRKMSILALKIALIFIVAFGSLGGTLAAATDSLPGSFAYSIKISLEKARLAFAKDSDEQATMHLEFAQERVQEMVRLADKDHAPEEELLARTQMHMRSAYQLSAEAGNEQIQDFLAEAFEAARVSQSELEVAQEQAHARVREQLEEASGFMFQWQYEAENGMQDPEYLRWRYGQGGPCVDIECQPPYEDGDQEQEQHQYGPGAPPCEGDECQPPYGDGDQEQNQQQLGPVAPPCESDDCQAPYGDGDQEQEQHQYGPGAPPCEGDDCQAPHGDGDQEQNQEQSNEQNQAQGDTQNQNQEQNGDGPEDPQSGDSGDPGGSENSDNTGGTSGASGDSDGSGGAGR